MDPIQSAALQSLLAAQPVAALATLHKGEPAVSMVPYALLSQGRGVVIHVSGLAAHTADMLAHAAVALLVTGTPESAATPLALPRASLQGWAAPCPPDSTDYAEARALYLARFPDSEAMFGFADFSLFIVRLRMVRFVGGFGRAHSLTAEQFAALMGGPIPAPATAAPRPSATPPGSSPSSASPNPAS